jgi:hypothetical protein
MKIDKTTGEIKVQSGEECAELIKLAKQIMKEGKANWNHPLLKQWDETMNPEGRLFLLHVSAFVPHALLGAIQWQENNDTQTND